VTICSLVLFLSFLGDAFSLSQEFLGERIRVSFLFGDVYTAKIRLADAIRVYYKMFEAI
jgi:hypothetical protein